MHPCRNARLNPVAPEQLVGCPSELGAAVPIQLGNPSFKVYRQQYDFGGVQIPLGPIALISRYGIEIAVLVNATDLPCQCHDQLFIVLRERLSLVPDETDPAVDVGW